MGWALEQPPQCIQVLSALQVRILSRPCYVYVFSLTRETLGTKSDGMISLNFPLTKGEPYFGVRETL